MKFNLFYVFALSLGLVFFSSCGEEKDPSCADENLAGMIDGTDFTFADGTADVSDDDISLDFYSIDEVIGDDVCDLFGGDANRIFGSLPNTTERTELMGIFSGGPTLTMLPAGTFNNIIITEGWVEFTSITETAVEGKMSIGSSDSNTVCGSFTLKVCN